MQITTHALLTESENLLLRLRRQHERMPFLVAPEIIRAVRQARRYLRADGLGQKRITVGRELVKLMCQTQGVWRGARGRTTLPDYLKEGLARQNGESSSQAIAKFFQQMRLDAELRKFVAIVTHQPWQKHERLYTKWKLLRRRERLIELKQKTARQKMWYLVRLLRAGLSQPVGSN